MSNSMPESGNLSPKQELLLLLSEKQRRQRHNRMLTFYPDAGPLRRELYQKHTAFFAAGAQHRERLMMSANRVGKTLGVGAYESTVHLTGRYPAWWKGHRFTRPIRAWAAGDTSKSVREIVQEALLGPPGNYGTGMIPGDTLGKITPKSGIPEAVDTIYVRHASGGESVLALKSYDQGREAYQGTAQDIIWLDEEPPEDIHAECVMRTMGTAGFGGGWLMVTFTPVNGWTRVVEKFVDEQEREKTGRFLIVATWDDAPHLSDSEKARMWAALPPYQRDARSKGVPALGSGAIYQVPESDIVVADFAIPDHWPRGYALDVGWNRTAALWGAHDRESGVLYLYSEHYRATAEPVIHTEAIKARGAWIAGVIDPAARGSSQADGRQLLQVYRGLGLSLSTATHAVEAGIYTVWELLSAGKLKVFASLSNWRAEYRLYRRDDKGKIVKENDHLMDGTRYLVVGGLEWMKVKPVPPKKPPQPAWQRNDQAWMA